jgi:hypothetical protein
VWLAEIDHARDEALPAAGAGGPVAPQQGVRVGGLRPDAGTSREEPLQQVVMSLCLDGNSYTRVYRNTLGDVVSLVVLDPTRMQIRRDRFGDIEYVWDSSRILTRQDIKHITMLKRPGSLKGVGPLDEVKQSFGSAQALDEFADYWEQVRSFYAPFDTSPRTGSAEVYLHEMPGGQFTNLKEQARGMGILHHWPEIARTYAEVNQLFGDIVKVTPSSKVVGDMTMFLITHFLIHISRPYRNLLVFEQFYPDALHFFIGD